MTKTELRDEEEVFRQKMLEENRLNDYYLYYKLKAELGCMHLSNKEYESIYTLNFDD